MAVRELKLTVGNTAGDEALMKSYKVDDGKDYLIPTYKMTVSGKDDAGNPASKEFKVIRYGIKCETAGGRVYVVGLSDDQSYTIKQWIPDYSPDTNELGAWRVKDNYLVHDGPNNIANDRFGAVGCIEVCGTGQFDALNEYLISVSGLATSTMTRGEKLATIAASHKLSIHYLQATPPPLKEKT